MKIVFVALRLDLSGPHFVVRVANSMGHDASVVAVDDPQVLELTRDADVVVPFSFNSEHYPLAVQLAESVPLVPGPDGLLLKDKWLAYVAMQKSGADTPPTFLLSDTNPDDLIAKFGEVVTKPRSNGLGNGVAWCTTADAVREEFAKGAEIAQPAYRAAWGRDTRVVVVNGQIVMRVVRQASDGEFRSNLALGGSGFLAEADPEVDAVALQAASALGLMIAGVDVIATGDPNRPYTVCEVNVSPMMGDNFPGSEGAATAWVNALMLEVDALPRDNYRNAGPSPK